MSSRAADALSLMRDKISSLRVRNDTKRVMGLVQETGAFALASDGTTSSMSKEQKREHRARNAMRQAIETARLLEQLKGVTGPGRETERIAQLQQELAAARTSADTAVAHMSALQGQTAELQAASQQLQAKVDLAEEKAATAAARAAELQRTADEVDSLSQEIDDEEAARTAIAAQGKADKAQAEAMVAAETAATLSDVVEMVDKVTERSKEATQDLEQDAHLEFCAKYECEASETPKACKRRAMMTRLSGFTARRDAENLYSRVHHPEEVCWAESDTTLAIRHEVPVMLRAMEPLERLGVKYHLPTLPNIMHILRSNHPQRPLGEPLQQLLKEIAKLPEKDRAEGARAVTEVALMAKQAVQPAATSSEVIAEVTSMLEKAGYSELVQKQCCGWAKAMFHPDARGMESRKDFAGEAFVYMKKLQDDARASGKCDDTTPVCPTKITKALDAPVVGKQPPTSARSKSRSEVHTSFCTEHKCAHVTPVACLKDKQRSMAPQKIDEANKSLIAMGTSKTTKCPVLKRR